MKSKCSFIVATLLFFTTVTSANSQVHADPDILSLEQAVQKIEECDNKIENNMDNLDKLKEQIKERENEIKDNTELLKIAQEKVEERDNQLAERLNGIQLNGGLEITSFQYMDALFSSGNILDAVQKLSLINQICTSDKKLIIEAKESRRKFLDINDKIDAQYKDLEKNRGEVENKIKDLEEQKQGLLKFMEENGELLSGSTDITVPVALPSDISDSTKKLIEDAEKYLKVPYLWGGESPDGFDCSGFMQYVFKAQGIDLPRISEEQQKFATTINMSEINPGDLVFNKPSEATHVGMYIGNDMYIQASHSGDVVKISRLSKSSMKYAGRVLD
ncbi:glycoside hydrolase [Clostridium chromiireducens]|uniref:Glycoside hydrolase n=1 Tax=Clostridium chromiireducens TaxID=225345 RepID=A0A964W2M9_9CLOT|nr:C40 family peptidase [Clostridium chromiireducens]MVX64419.1 glycoside hydrolase [Clostridium chromiireducens]